MGPAPARRLAPACVSGVSLASACAFADDPMTWPSARWLATSGQNPALDPGATLQEGGPLCLLDTGVGTATCRVKDGSTTAWGTSARAGNPLIASRLDRPRFNPAPKGSVTAFASFEARDCLPPQGGRLT